MADLSKAALALAVILGAFGLAAFILVMIMNLKKNTTSTIVVPTSAGPVTLPFTYDTGTKMTTFANPVTFSNTVSMTGKAVVTGPNTPVTVKSTMNVLDTATLTDVSASTVTANTANVTSLTTSGTTTMNSMLNVAGPATFAGVTAKSCSVTGAATVGGNLTVAGTSTLKGTVTTSTITTPTQDKGTLNVNASMVVQPNIRTPYILGPANGTSDPLPVNLNNTVFKWIPQTGS